MEIRQTTKTWRCNTWTIYWQDYVYKEPQYYEAQAQIIKYNYIDIEYPTLLSLTS